MHIGIIWGFGLQPWDLVLRIKGVGCRVEGCGVVLVHFQESRVSCNDLGFKEHFSL